MDEQRITERPSWNDPRGQEMKTPEDVAAMVRLKACGWGIKRIARELGCSHHTVKHYVNAGGPVPFEAPQRPKILDGHENWLRERFLRHRGNADVVRQDLIAEKGIAVSLRTLQRAVQPYRQALKAEALATVRFETPPGGSCRSTSASGWPRSATRRSRRSCSWRRWGTRGGFTCGRSGTNARRAGSQASRAPSRHSAACRRRC